MEKTMEDKRPLAVVVNGTAEEGYWAVYYLLKSGRFNVRATARRLDGKRVERLKRLDEYGKSFEIVRAATDDKHALKAAFQGAHSIYGTSIYNIYAKKYRSANPEEMAQCGAVIDAVQSCSTLEHFVWQTMGRLDLPPESIGLEAPIHFRTKWHWEEVIRDSGLPWTFLCQPAYMRQVKFGMQYRNRLVYPYAPDARLPYVAEEDIGKFVAAIFCDRESHLQKTVNGVSEVVSPVELAARAHALNQRFSPNYRQATWIENAIFDHIVVRLRPAFRYPFQINQNIKAGNYFAMTLDDKEYCQKLISPLKLTTLEEWLRRYFDTIG
jgi:hypothetical protein